MSHYFISASIEMTEGSKLEQVETELQKLVAQTRKEPGCILFEIRQNLKEPTKFTLWECWTNPGALAAHFEADHTNAYLAQNLTEVSYIEALGEIGDTTFADAIKAHG